jgi:glycine/D-amino acid oxidase-like deaminating enzyme
MILRIVRAEVCGPHLLRLAFNDGTHKTVDAAPLLVGPVFEPLRDPAYFARAELDRVCGAVDWPNGADFAPEALHALAAVQEPTVA